MATPDAVLARRARVERLARLGRRTGYAAFGVAMAVFGFGAAVGFSSLVVAVVTVALGGGSVVLAPAIVLGYGVKAAAREDREAGRRRPGPGPPAV